MSTVCHAVREHVNRDPGREMFTFRDLDSGVDHRLTYGGLWAGGSVVAEALDGAGKHPRVLIVLPLGLELVSAHLGALLAGGVPVIHSHPSSKVAQPVYLKHLAHVLELMQPDVVLTNLQFRDAIRDTTEAHVPTVIAVEDLPGSTTFVPTAWQAAVPNDIAVIQHSSGSTGLQKGVALTHAMVLQQCHAYAKALAVDRDTDRVCSWIPLYHDMGLFTTWLLPVIEGIPVAAIDPFAWVQSPVAFLRLVHDVRGTLCWQPNFAYNLLATRVKDEDLEGLDISCMRGFSNCSEPVRASSHRMFVERFRTCGVSEDSLWVCYAMAENAFAVTAAGSSTMPVVVTKTTAESFARGVIDGADVEQAIEIVSVGAPIAGCEVKVVDAERTMLADGHVGEVALRSSYMLREYYRNSEETERAIDNEGWYYTGDLGFCLDGQLYITGRQKDLLIVGGRNFYPQDIESVADTCPHALPGRSVAIGVDDELTGTQRIILLVESKTEDPVEKTQLTTAVRERVLENLDCPLSELHVVPHMWLLKTTSGKIARSPNLERFRQEMVETAGARQIEPGGFPLLSTVGWGFLVALALYVIFAFQPNLSWGIYAGF